MWLGQGVGKIRDLFDWALKQPSCLLVIDEFDGYDDLEVKDGATASALLEALLLDADGLAPAATAELRRNLLGYCERDTLAMVKLYERLTELAS